MSRRELLFWRKTSVSCDKGGGEGEVTGLSVVELHPVAVHNSSSRGELSTVANDREYLIFLVSNKGIPNSASRGSPNLAPRPIYGAELI